MRPSLYFRRNQAKAALLVGLIAIGVAGAIVVTTIFASFGDTRQWIASMGTKWVTVQSLSPIDTDKMLDELTRLGIQSVDLYNATTLSLGYPMFGTAVAGFGVYALSADSVGPVLEIARTALTEGHLPTAPREVALPVALLYSRGLGIGDVWEEQNPYLSQGSYDIVGSLSGGSPLGLTFPDKNTTEFLYTTILINEDLESLESAVDQIYAAVPNVTVEGPSSIRHHLSHSYRSYLLLATGITLSIALVVALTLALVSGQEWRNRRSELALLGIIGYQPRALCNKAMLELAGMALTGWFVGSLLGCGIVGIITQTVFAAQGMTLAVSTGRLFVTLIIPLSVAVESILFITATLRKDPVQMVDAFGADQ